MKRGYIDEVRTLDLEIYNKISNRMKGNNPMIKIRIWNKKEKKYEDLSGLSTICLKDGVIDVKESEYTVEQCTGLKDMHGQEIYEGDIIKSDRFYPSLVGYDECYACFLADDINFMDADQEWEIIGNIHENPELLEDAE